ncbi:MAG TPA: cytochrome P450 [Gemmatimonadaceae bacterium]|nr:cytochrome P450 [Gemmatimonadaceae bacterium]
MNGYPTTSVGDLCNLGARAVWAAVRHPRSFDGGLVLHDWMKDMTVRYGSGNVFLNLLVMRLLLVTDRDLSRHILADYPSSTGYVAGTLKRRAMSSLAPQALTIADDAPWRQLRPFNERVLCTGRPHEFQRTFLAHVRRAFAAQLSSIDDVRDRMGRAMLSIVFGDGVAPDHLADDIRVLFGLVQNPLARLLRGAAERPRVDRLYAGLRQAWQRSDAQAQVSLLAIARSANAGEAEDTLLQQIPHWMFTFSGSGADLLARGLTMIGSRPDVLARVRTELAAAGPLDQPASVDGLRFLEACLLESARLFPPVTRTFHRAMVDDGRVPAGAEILQVFSLTQRDGAADPTANQFRPDRWLSSANQAEAAYPNLFLSGARKCPGRDLILFVAKSAASVTLAETGRIARSDVLARDPVPFSFPERRVQFTSS